MTSNDNRTVTAAELRKRAEAIDREKADLSPEIPEDPSQEEIGRILHELRVHQVELEIQNEELRRSQMELESSRARYFNFYDLAPVGYFTLSDKGLILEANLTSAILLETDRGVLVKQPLSRYIHKEDHDIFYLHINRILKTGEPQTCELRMIKTDGAVFWAHLAATCEQDSGDARICSVVLSDITERKLREEGHALTTRLITRISTPGDFRKRISELTASLHDWSGCEAIGIRLRSGDDYPYYETRGFPPEFVQTESRLCAYGPDGKVLRDGIGNPVLECMCGNVLCGRVDPAKTFFTNHGSFCSNDTTALLAATTEADRLARTRNRCNGMGYESVALIPLRIGDQVFGLLQLNDHRPDRFTPGLIAQFERMADDLAIALSQLQAVKALQESERLYRSLFENMLNGFAYCRMLFKDGKPEDFVYLAVNDAFTLQTGLKDVVGKKVTEVIPGIRQTDPGLFEIYGSVATSGQPQQFEIFMETLKMWFWVSVYSPAYEHFVAVFDVITARKQTEQSLEIARNVAINEKKRLEAVMEALPVGIAIVDKQGGTIRSNKIYEALWGPSLPATKDVRDYEAYNAWWLDTGNPVQPDAWASARAVQKGETVLGQMIEIESFDGVRKIVMNSAAPVYDANGSIVGSAVAIHDVTKIKRMEREAIARASELEAVFSAQIDAVIMYDTRMNVKQVNLAFLSAYGFDPVGLNVREIMRRLSCRRLDGRMMLLEEQPTPRALLGEKVTGSFFVVTLPDGSDRIIETSSGPMRQGERITGTVTVWHDITEFKRAEEKQRESQERLILAAGAGQVGMFDLNMESGELQWTQRHEMIFGYAPTASTAAKRTYQDWSDRVHPDDLPKVEAHMRHAMEARIPFNIEYRLVWPDKSVHWVNVSSKYYFEESGRCKRLMGAVMDITERKQSEERLQELSQRLTYHVDNSPLAVIEWGPDMRLTRWSNMAERIFGWKAAEVIGKRMEDFRWIYVEDAQQVDDASSDLQTGSNPRRFSSNRNYRKDGTVVHCEWYNSSLLDESGKLRSIMSLVLDVTERKVAEDRLQASLKEKDVLLKEIHHRVKNNMQVISSLISLQADSVIDTDLQSVLADIRNRVRTMALVHEKLYQTKDMARLDFAEYASSLLNYLWSAHGDDARNVHLNTLLAPLIMSIEMAVPVGLILNELASNAIKYAFPGGREGEVTVTLSHDPATGDACLRVRDDGVGLPEDLAWQQSSSLGLRLVQMLTGQIRGTVKTGACPGTEFQINFNLKGNSHYDPIPDEV